MSRFVRVVQIACDANGHPLCSPDKAEEEGVFLRYGIVDRKKKNKTFFSSRTPDNTNERYNELRAAQIVQGRESENEPEDFTMQISEETYKAISKTPIDEEGYEEEEDEYDDRDSESIDMPFEENQ